MMELAENWLKLVVQVAIIGFEIVGVGIIIYSGVIGVKDFFTKNPRIRLNLAQGMALGLEFKLGSEILRTVIVRELSEVGLVAAIIAVRAALTFLIHWEIKEEAKIEK